MPGMQFPYPRKSSHPPPYRNSKAAAYRQKRALKTYAPPVLGLLALIWFLLHFTSRPSHNASKLVINAPTVVIVTTLDPRLPEAFKEGIKENRREYAARHGYTTFFPNTTDYNVGGHPDSWSMVPALRHAMTLHPHTPWMWSLASTALIMNSTESLQAKLLAPRTIERLMITEQPVVPPDSVIKTYAGLAGESIDFLLAQDADGLAPSSAFVRTGDWAKYLLDMWYDPLFRSYNFQQAERHTLEHIVQWHGTILAKMALIPQRTINSYMLGDGQNMQQHDGLYQDGDFIANFHGCDSNRLRSCPDEMHAFMAKWRSLREHEKQKS